ncbi:MAG: methyltransferase domain-containing protein [Cyclobacteriaceae bacterium]|nr:methyltransferase domain-containing protein [Cyclobacteriaceae bacterium]
MNSSIVFDEHVADYEAWYDQYPAVFKSEVEALRDMLPERKSLTGIEVYLGSGRLAQALGIMEGVEPSAKMRTLAVRRGIDVMNASAESLPYKDLKFDIVLISLCKRFVHQLAGSFKEAYRVLKNEGALVVGFLDNNSTLGRAVADHQADDNFYRSVAFYPVNTIVSAITQAGFRHITITQTLFGSLEEITTMQVARRGYGEGSFVVLKALK